MDLFDIRPQTAALKYGAEPSFRMLLRQYYGEHFSSAADVDRLVDEYIAKFNEITSK